MFVYLIEFNKKYVFHRLNKHFVFCCFRKDLKSKSKVKFKLHVDFIK